MDETSRRNALMSGDVQLLHASLIQLEYPIPKAEQDRGEIGPETRRALVAFQESQRLERTGELDAQTVHTLAAALEGIKGFSLEGIIVSPDRVGVGGLAVEVVDRQVGEDLLLAKTTSTPNGEFGVRFAITGAARKRKIRPDLQALVKVGGKVIGTSEVRYNATASERVIVRLPADMPLPSEYETLLLALGPYVKDLSAVEESDRRQDITYLANKTGWDARMVAMAALAAQLAALRVNDGRADVGLDAALYYALLRAGLPGDPQRLFLASSATVLDLWRRAIKQGVIPTALGATLDRSATVFGLLSAARVIDARAFDGGSTARELLSLSVGDDAVRQQRVAQLFVTYRNDTDGFWKAVARSEGDATAKQLRVNGQLGYLTLNNVPLIRRLHAANGRPLESIGDLPARGYYQPDQWEKVIGDDVPPVFGGASTAERRKRYAGSLAARVRLAYPTAVIASQIERGAMLQTPDDVRKEVSAFFREHQGKFELGIHPVDQYLSTNKLDAKVRPAVRTELRRLQRVFQITPDDTAMRALLARGLDSARAVTRIPERDFVAAVGAELGGETAARQVHAKARQVHAAVVNIATSYMLARHGTPVGVHSPPQLVDPVPANAGDVVAYATLESLVGSMDFCACSHCRSVLSPAAYLVDLLQELDRDPAAWTIKMNAWSAAHGGADYPFADMAAFNAYKAAWIASHPAGPAPPDTKLTPLQVLLERRPDLERLPLTCENTNTPLPYIDLVNETLEYYVTNGLSLANFAGHDTNPSTPADELMANPQFVNDTAYERLRDIARPESVFPYPLPFHRPLEMLRRFFTRFEVPLPVAMETVRSGDQLERANAQSYGWRDILMERLGLSRQEYALLTDRTISVQVLFGYDAARPVAGVLAELANVKTLSRHLDVKYTELVEILKTSFINPSATLIPRLERLHVTFTDIKTYFDARDNAAFDALLPNDLDPVQYGGVVGGDAKAAVRAWITNQANYDRIMGLITISNPVNADESCSLDALELRYAKPDMATNQLRAIDFIRLSRFVRLWRKLRWSIAQTDEVIGALYPANQLSAGLGEADDLVRLDNGFLVMLPRIGVASQAMERLKLKPARDLSALLASWASISTRGEGSLYRKMFLGTAPPIGDAAFADNGYGDVLTNAAVMLLDHAEPLRAAFNVTGEDLTRIVTYVGSVSNPVLAANAVPLTLPFVSAVFRWAWLARALKLSVRELLLLAARTDLDPFAAPDPPNPPFLRLLSLVQAMREAGLKPVQALYLVWNQDVSGVSAPTDAAVRELARALRDGFAGVERAFTVVDDPGGDITRARMALVYGNDATDFFFGLLNDTQVSTLSYSHPDPALSNAITAVGGERLVYDDLRKRISYTGVMTVALRNALQAVAGVPQVFIDIIGDLYQANQAAVGGFFARYPELMPLYTAYVAGAADPQVKRATVLAAFLPALRDRRKGQQALTTVAADVRTTADMASAVLGNVAVLHAAADAARPGVNDLTAIERSGLSARFYWRNTATNPVNATSDAEAVLDYAAATAVLLPPNGAAAGSPISGIWSGYIEAPESGPFGFSVETDAAATVTLRVDGVARALGAPVNGLRRTQQPIELVAGSLVPFELVVENVTDRVAVRWQSTGRGWEIIPSRYLYSALLTDRLRSTYVRFRKAASLAEGLKLIPAELAHFATRPEYFIGAEGWLNALSVSGDPVIATSRALRDVLIGLLDHARLKAALSPTDDRLLAVLRDPAATTSAGVPLVLGLTGWEAVTLDALLGRFGWARADLARPERFHRVFEAYALVRQCGISAAALLAATHNDPTAAAVRDLQSALRARYDRASWLATLKGVQDEMRARQRDALVAYVLRRMAASPASRHIDTPDKLFEYFLMDVQMEPCMQTSRIRHALSSVQLFVERCLLNLEPRVPPDNLDETPWPTMKRYRVWEAARKCFLWPENWLEPELRDDQSPFFKEAMGELLQSDINEESAATALVNYLGKLAEVAKLEPCGLFQEEHNPGAQDDVVHVIARAPGAHRKYYYRRQDNGVSWMPWEALKLDIEDNPVAPVVWNGRLFLFWLRILKQPPFSVDRPGSADGTSNLSSLQVKDIKTNSAALVPSAVLCWSERYNGKWQPPRTSDIDAPVSLGTFGASAAVGTVFDRSRLALRFDESGDRLIVNVLGATAASSFVLYNTHSLPGTGELVAVAGAARELKTEGNQLVANHTAPSSKPKPRSILTNKTDPSGDRAIGPRHHVTNPGDAPFFYWDRRHAFYVTATSKTVTLTKETWVGVPVSEPGWIEDLPWLVREVPDWMIPIPPEPDPYSPFAADPVFDPQVLDAGGNDAGVLSKFLNGDSYIKVGINTSAPVVYGTRAITPSGSTAMPETGGFIR